MKFRYKEITADIKRPIIPIVLEHNGRSLALSALIDSGADLSVFPAEVCEALGIDIAKGEKGALGGVVAGKIEPYYIHRLTLSVGGKPFDNVPVAFMPNLSRLGHGLLGQKGFFDLYSIKFDLPRGEIELKEHVSLPY
jgi:Aspartyl protease